jgi:DNA-directed RNA polymerase subunit M/transcription elongation factor TFIIS
MNEETIRNICIEKFNSIIDNYDISKSIEESVFQYVVNNVCSNKNTHIDWDNIYFKRTYMNKCISLYTNLNSDSYVNNKELIEKITNGNIDPYKIAFMTPQELFPQNWEAFMEKEKAKNEFLYTKKLESFTDEYKCGRCKQSKCSYYQVFTRSLDEPAVLYFTCLNCGHKWKM